MGFRDFLLVEKREKLEVSSAFSVYTAKRLLAGWPPHARVEMRRRRFLLPRNGGGRGGNDPLLIVVASEFTSESDPAPPEARAIHRKN